MNASEIGTLVTRRRQQAGLTQRELAERIGTTQPAISKIEAGRTLPSLGLLERVARATGGPITLTIGRDRARPSRRELRERVRRVLGDYEFNPWEREPTAAEAESLVADGLTRERFAS
ncbi:MAG TPA: helix-turn-helix transcriptional regulator [Actinomycetota bacterium]